MPSSNPGQFTNPWTTPGPMPSRSLYTTSKGLNTNLGLDREDVASASNVSMGSYAGVHGTAASALGDVYESQDLLTIPQELLSQCRVLSTSLGFRNEVTCTSALSAGYNIHVPISTAYDPMGYVPPAAAQLLCAIQQQSQDHSRGLTLPCLQSKSTRSFGNTVGASKAMITISENTTPRDTYEAQGCIGRGSGDSYGFSAAHSTSWSMSMSTSENYPPYLGGSINSSVSDSTKSSSDIESISSRTLLRCSRLPNRGIAPRPSSMTGRFSSKDPSKIEKKHKCKVCDKRFTRPSSLQTHIYSHTGEKPFSCDADGCGRHFSVVSNLRRHRKVHKGQAPSEAGSKDHQLDE